MNNYEYPEGADNKTAPWNKKELPEKYIDVCISVTLSKTVKVKVTDYTIIDSGKDENGEHYEDIDYSSCDLKEAVEEQIILPQNTHCYVNYEPWKKQLKGWNVDDFECIIE